MSQETYEQLDENEKVALGVAILYPYHTLKEVLPKLFKFEASLSTYYRMHDEGRKKLIDKGILDSQGRPTEKAFEIIPIEKLRPTLKDLYNELMKLKKEKDESETKKDNEINELRMNLQNVQEMFDFTIYHDLTPLPQALQKDIDKAILVFKEKSYDLAIVKTYTISETLVKNLFAYLYGNEELEKVHKHENRLKKIWADEEKEKKKYPGLLLLASLFSVILWYRNKMGAHKELKSTKEAARICLESLFQSIRQLKEMKLENLITTYV
jgi:hypothetical protein